MGMICPNCRSENKEGAKFCNECGFPLTGRMAAVAAASTSDDTLRSIAAEETRTATHANECDFRDSDTTPTADETPKADVPSAAVTADLSGLNEYLTDASYTPPASAWHSGGTMEMPRVEGKAAPKQKEFRAPDTPEKKRGHTRAIILVVVLLLVGAAAAAAITYQMELWGGKVVPDVAGMTQADATYQLEDKGFTVRATKVKSDETEGLVLLTDPEAGGRIEEGSEVVIHVATPRRVPDVVGKMRDEAEKLFQDEGFTHVSFVEEKSDTDEGTVLSLTPEAGEKAKASTEITVTVAVPFTVPDVVNQSLDTAQAALKEASYESEVVYYYTEDVVEGTVVETNPAAGEKLESGSSVTIHVAKSRASVLVPLAKERLAPGNTLALGGVSFEIIALEGVQYTAHNETSFTVRAKAVTTVDGDTFYGPEKSKNGVIVWNDDDEIVSIS